MVVPYFVSRLLAGVVTSQFLLNFLEGIVRVVIFLLYLVAISHMNDIKEHLCIMGQNTNALTV